MALAALVTPTDGAHALVLLGDEVTLFTPKNLLGMAIAIIAILMLYMVRWCCWADHVQHDPPA
eukprot:1036603-Alexandrium_andersonii.AAC.1